MPGKYLTINGLGSVFKKYIELFIQNICWILEFQYKVKYPEQFVFYFIQSDFILYIFAYSIRRIQFSLKPYFSFLNFIVMFIFFIIIYNFRLRFSLEPSINIFVRLKIRVLFVRISNLKCVLIEFNISNLSLNYFCMWKIFKTFKTGLWVQNNF